VSANDLHIRKVMGASSSWSEDRRPKVERKAMKDETQREASEAKEMTVDDLMAMGYTFGPPLMYRSADGLKMILKAQLFDPTGAPVTITYGRPNTTGILTGIATNEADIGESD
jgi:hypothetical protein